MKNPTMLYRSPGPEVFEGVPCETTIVEDEDVEAHLADGWNRTWPGAAEDAKARADALKEAEEEAARIAAELAGATGKRAVHKGAGKWEVQDADGNVLASGLTKDEAHAQAAGG